uniref:RRM domain-containing protein n=1 Tax=Globisporangium ultimum (strain ATCC 200006 / CBS 805.95 / DAOM BR144) TaxID=431595 RepID=K3WLQ8_GLOUD
MARAHDDRDASKTQGASSLENDEEAIRAKLRESGWEKKKRTDSKDLAGAKEASGNGRKASNADDDDAASGKKREGDTERESRRRGSARSRRSRSRRRDDDRRDRERDRDSRRRRDRSAKRGKPSSRRRRSRSDSKSRSRSVSQSRSRRPSHRRRGASPSRSVSRGKESSSRRSRRASKSRSPSTSGKKKEADGNETGSDPETKEEPTRRSKSADGHKEPKRDTSEKAADKDAMEVDEEGVGKKPAEETSEQKGKDANGSSSSQRKGRKSSRRSRSKSRSPSRSSRRRRHRSRSRSPSRSRRRRSSRSRSRSRGRRNDRRRHRSRTPSRSRSNSRRRRRSSSKDKKRRDANSSPEPHEHPPGVPAPPVAAVVNPTITQLMQQYPTMSLQEIIAKMQASNVTMAAAVAMKPARELYVGNLPPNVTGPQLQEFLGTIIQQVGLSLQPGNPILNTWISTDGHFAFCEMRSVEECNLALLLNQLSLLGQPLKFGRPRSFMGPPQPMPVVSSRTQTALVNLGCTPNPVWFAPPTLGVSTFGAAAPPLPTTLPPSALPVPSMAHSVAAPAAIVAPAVPASNTSALLASLPADPNSKRLLMSNIPVVLAEDQVKELVQPFGDLKNFTLLKDNVTGASTGNALFEYQDDSAADEALQGLNDLDIGGIPLSVRRAPQDASAVDETSVVVKLANMVSVDELKDDEEYADLKEDVEEECKRFGAVVAMEIPRPQNEDQSGGVGNIYVRFNDKSEAASALKALSGRKFGGNIVRVTYYPLAKFESKEFAYRWNRQMESNSGALSESPVT